jgi:hypothetical protein
MVESWAASGVAGASEGASDDTTELGIVEMEEEATAWPMTEKSGSMDVGFAASLETCIVAALETCIVVLRYLPNDMDEGTADGAPVGRMVTVVLRESVLVLVTSIVSTGSSSAPRVTVTFSTSVVVTVSLEHVVEASGVACSLIAFGVMVTVPYSYFVVVTV